jgi:pimeloyl-ACP methyl ester carboxylesterase
MQNYSRTLLIVLYATTGICSVASKPDDAAIAMKDQNGSYLSRDALRLKYGDKRGKIAVIGDVEVYYKDEGRGPAILLVHGSQSNLKTWDGVAAGLVSHYRVIRYDIPPQGLSGPVTDAALAHLQPTDIAEQLLRQLGVMKVTVVGVSSGGTLAIQLAAKDPGLVERIIVSNAPADPVTTGHLVFSVDFAAQTAEEKRTGRRSQAYWNAFLDFFGGLPSHFDRAMRQQYYDINRRSPEPNLVALAAKVADHDAAVTAMHNVRQPVLLIWGARDPLLPLPACRVLGDYLVNASVSQIILPDVGHYPPVEVPQRYAKLVAAYIEAAGPP